MWARNKLQHSETTTQHLILLKLCSPWFTAWYDYTGYEFLYKLWCKWDAVKGAYWNVTGQHQNRYYGHWRKQNEMWQILSYTEEFYNYWQQKWTLLGTWKLCLIWEMRICNKPSNSRAQYYGRTEILALMKTNVFTKSSSNSTYWRKRKLGSKTVMNESNIECGWPKLISRHQVTLIQQPDITVEE